MSAEIQTLHKPFADFLRAEGIPFTYHDPSRPTGATLGDADFVLYWHGRCAHIEFKDKEGRISASQKKRHAELAAAGCTVHILRDLDAAVELTRAWLSCAAPVAEQPKAGAETCRFAQAVWTRPDSKAAWQRVRTATADDIHIPLLK